MALKDYKVLHPINMNLNSLPPPPTFPFNGLIWIGMAGGGGRKVAWRGKSE